MPENDHAPTSGEISGTRRAWIYVVFFLLFWIPLLVLVRKLGFSESNALIAAGLGVVPLLLLFVPLFERLAERLSSVKFGDFELAFKQALDESLAEPSSEPFEVRLDNEREMLEKGGPGAFSAFAKRNLLNRELRVVLKLDVARLTRVRMDMLYFQARYLSEVFDFRALVILDSRGEPGPRWIIGTLSPRRLFSALDGRYPGLSAAFSEAMVLHRVDPRQGVAAPMPDALWRSFLDRVRQSEAGLDTGISPETMSGILEPLMERNFLRLPVGRRDYHLLLSYFERRHDNVVLFGPGGDFQVRSIDRIARELSRAYVEAQMVRGVVRHDSTEDVDDGHRK
jgi:hypothetical protein